MCERAAALHLPHTCPASGRALLSVPSRPFTCADFAPTFPVSDKCAIAEQHTLRQNRFKIKQSLHNCILGECEALRAQTLSKRHN